MIAAAPAAVSLTDQAITPELRRLLATLGEALPGAYLVGGAVRDLLGGRTPRDLDVITSDDPHAGGERLAQRLGAHVFALDEERGHYRIALTEDAPVGEIDISHYDDLQADLLRRDFTIDAMARPIAADGALGELIDPTGGASDMQAVTLRMVSEAALLDDPLRLLRAARLAVELELDLDAETEETIRNLAFTVTRAAPERQRDELTRILGAPRAVAGVRLLDMLGLLQELLPEITAARGVDQPQEHHYWDVFDHSVETVAALDAMFTPQPTPDLWFASGFRDGLAGFDLDGYIADNLAGHSRLTLIKLAGLLHDVSKPETKLEQPDGRIRFFGHPEQGAEKATNILRRLRFGTRETEFVSLLVEEHLRPTQLSNGDELPSKRALYRFYRDLGDAAPACLFLSLADAAAARGPRLQPDRWRGHVAYVAWILEQAAHLRDAPAAAPRLVDGETLMAALGLEPGPQLGRLLAAIDEAHAVGELTTPDEAIEYARELAGEASPPAAASPSPLAERRIDSLAGDAHKGRSKPTRPVNWAENKPRAREMRHVPTEAEAVLWNALRRKQLGVNFRRQHPIHRFIVDFYCPDANLAVELDGPVHEATKQQDEDRQAFIEALGVGFLRFTNDEVLLNIAGVLDRIREYLSHAAAATSPSPPAGRGTEGEGP